MGALGDVVVRIGADLRDFSTAMQNVRRDLGKMGSQLKSIGASLSVTISAPLAALGVASVKAAADMEALMMGLEAVTGSADAAKKEFEQLKEVAKLPGLGLQEAVRGSINLQAIGLNAEYARTAMMAMGNAIATVGGGKENFDLAIRGFSQLANASKPLQQDLYQIANQVPQVNKILIDTFGTNRAEDLAAFGMTGKQLADTLIVELGKLPPVTGGIKNAFENLKDSVSISLATIGDSIVKNLALDEIITKIAEGLQGLAEKFANLPGGVQKAILAIAGIAIVIGPILLALGALSTAIAAISLPVVAIVAAIGGAVALIIAYWDELVEYFSSSGEGGGVFDTVATVAVQLFEILKSIFESIYAVVVAIWSAIWPVIVEVMRAAWSIVGGILKRALDLVLNVVNVFKGLLTGNWQLLWDSLKNIVFSFINGIIDLIKFLVDVILDGVRLLLDSLGIGDDIIKSFDKARKGLDNWVEGLKYQTTTAKETQKTIDDLANSWKGLNTEVSKSGTEMKKPNLQIKSFSKPKQVDTQQFSADAASSLMSTGTSKITGLLSSISEGFNNATDNVKSFASNAAMALTTMGQNTALEMMQQRLQQFNEAIVSSIQNMVVDVVSSFAEMIGQMIVTGKGMEKLPYMVLGALGGLAQQIGKMAIGIAIAMIGIKKTLESLNPVAAFAAGVALLALGAAVKGLASKAAGSMGGGGGGVPALATGGVAFGPTLAMVGDNRSASTDPEVIAPLSKLKGMLGDTGGGWNGVVEFFISGADLKGVLQRQEEKERRGA